MSRLRLNSIPASNRALAWTAIGVTACVSLLLLGGSYGGGWTPGDADDALRLSMVRDLVQGRGWFDQSLGRLQPPLGVFMHWSRLVDGGLAATDLLVGEAGMRALWPLLWIAPAALAVLTAARAIAGEDAKGLAVLAAAGLLLLDQPLYGQFRPGRIDHHNVQIALCLLALAGAVARGSGSGAGARAAAMAGVATGLGLAIGMEALPFEAAIGAGLALELVIDPQAGRRVRAYGLGLAGAAAGGFLLQTPPQRWGVSVCDALGPNLVLALVAAGGGLCAAAVLTRKRSWRVRLAAVAVAGVTALTLYLGVKPDCIHGVFGEVDPRLRPFWFDGVAELHPIGRVLADAPAEAGVIILWGLVGAASLFGVVALRPRERRFDPALVTYALCLALAVATGFAAERMSFYLLWFALAPAGASLAGVLALSRPSARRLAGGVFVAAASLPLIGLALNAAGLVRRATPPPDGCTQPQAFAALARQAPGLVLGEIDLGSYVLAYTPSAALSAPYHRIVWGNLAAHAALAAPVGRALGEVRALHVGYVLECRGHRKDFDRASLAGDALQRRLDAGRPPAWLTPLTPPGAPLEIYRVSDLR